MEQLEQPLKVVSSVKLLLRGTKIYLLWLAKYWTDNSKLY